MASDAQEKDNLLDNPVPGSRKKKFIIAGVVCLIVIIAIVVTVVVLVKKHEKKQDEFVKTHTPCATYEGLVHRVKTDGGKKMDMYEFRNIPYALPPVGNLRWRPPVAWDKCDKNEVLKYKDDDRKCAQISEQFQEEGVEDCLILNVRTPYNQEESKTKKKLPVLIWIHGGGMIIGSSNIYAYYPDEQFTASLEVVSVSINYRLNIFGFLSLKELWITSGQNKSYGNYGIMDQIMALKWVQNNIEYFGGDKNQVTIFGESGGGKAVFDLISSPLAKGLFVKAIPSSGYPMSVFDTTERADEKSRMIVNNTGCNKEKADDIVNCLLALPVSTILYNMPMYENPNVSVYSFPNNTIHRTAPLDVIDNHVIPAPVGNIKETSNPNLEILIGSMAQEAETEKKVSTWDNLKAFLKPKIDSFQTGIYDQVINVYKEKREGKVTPIEITPQYVYTVASSDVLLSCQTNQIAQNLTKLENATVYRYMVSQTQLFGKNFIPTAFHAIDTLAMFGNHHLPNPSKADDMLKLNLRSIFKTFIHSQLSNEYNNKTIGFWNSKILATESPYHSKECEILSQYGFLKQSWGQIGV